MCELCSADDLTAARERDRLRRTASEFREWADLLDGLANGELYPHSASSDQRRARAHGLIRYLVEEWL